MLAVGEVVPLTVEKPAAGGSMIAHTGGQVVLVTGAIPGERVRARVNRIAKHLAYADTIEIEERSTDRRDFLGDRLCGGCLYAHIEYPRQLSLKSEVIVDAFARIARIPLTEPVSVAPSPEEGYRMRARAHVRGSTWGFFREGTHEVCDARQTRQLLPATCDTLDRLVSASQSDRAELVEIELTENIDASERVVFLGYRSGPPGSAPPSSTLASSTPAGSSGRSLESADSSKWSSLVAEVAKIPGVTGLVARLDDGRRPATASHGSSHVTDRILFPGDVSVALRRHVLSFFQGNRYLVGDLVAHVIDRIPRGSELVDLYAGVGLFSISAAAARGVRATAVEGDRFAAADLVANAAALADAGAGSASGGLESGNDGSRRAGSRPVVALHQPVETYSKSGTRPQTIVADPPRTGMSREAMGVVLSLEAPALIYVSCDVATLARDARRLSDAGYGIEHIAAFDLYPNTPHIESVVTFRR
ncbi:MAG TPA: TRAM domain-containing protein [Vicinamibacterales bacterium]|nr:TRAM domain-containing protein [Vicinamibacterales bacterium]